MNGAAAAGSRGSRVNGSGLNISFISTSYISLPSWLSVDNSGAQAVVCMHAMSRAKHPKKEVEDALRHAEEHGWRIEVGGSHAWGRMYCPYNDPECRCGEFCITSIWSTPKDAGNHARQLKRVVDNCAIRKRTVAAADDEGGEE